MTPIYRSVTRKIPALDIARKYHGEPVPSQVVCSFSTSSGVSLLLRACWLENATSKSEALLPLGAVQPLPQLDWTLIRATSLLMSRGLGNRGWTPGHPQQAGFPYQMLLGDFLAATHLLPAVCHRHPLSSFGVWADCCQLQCGSCHGRSSIVTSAVRVKYLCEVSTPKSLQGPRYFEALLTNKSLCRCSFHIHELSTSCIVAVRLSVRNRTL